MLVVPEARNEYSKKKEAKKQNKSDLLTFNHCSFFENTPRIETANTINQWKPLAPTYALLSWGRGFTGKITNQMYEDCKHLFSPSSLLLHSYSTSSFLYCLPEKTNLLIFFLNLQVLSYLLFEFTFVAQHGLAEVEQWERVSGRTDCETRHCLWRKTQPWTPPPIKPP